ncbi:MAG: acetyl-CoA carboxylase biotin carboxyl carrier protein subunit [Bacteroidales bacterium]|jgi:pyruvate carboxylase subunit B|nr:acetyl-CoA carboxylase biotin carboxyl carrier protein subunit [Bacteroidales bacterium]
MKESSTPKRTYYRQLYITVDAGQIYAFIPGTIIDIFVRKNQKVKKGDRLFSLHAMKMDNDICATIDGTIKSINVKKGQVVTKNDVLVEIEEYEDEKKLSETSTKTTKKDNKEK